jgi:hypothetical protein
MSEPDIHPTVKVARDLTEILRLHDALLTQAVHKAGDPLMPGGEAMVALGAVANLEAWENLTQASEALGRAYTSAEDEDPEEAWSAFQLIEFWSEAWRRERGAEYDMRPTIVSEASFLKHTIDWAWDNEPGWDDFAKDIRKARTRLETILLEGVRSKRGAPCMYDECRGNRLVRKLEPKRDEDGEKTWEWSDWHCPRCHRTWTEDAYARNVAAAAWRAQVEEIDGESWASYRYAATLTRRSEATIRKWVERGKVATVCVIVGRRTRFVRMRDVTRCDDEARERTTAA